MKNENDIEVENGIKVEKRSAQSDEELEEEFRECLRVAAEAKEKSGNTDPYYEYAESVEHGGQIRLICHIWYEKFNLTG